MSKKNPSRDRDEVYGQWVARPAEQRRRAGTETFIDDLWNSGVRLAGSQFDHYQHVMDVIRSKVTN
ncbi:hypothetical protein ACFOHT_02970 [Massilia oculi]|uniref:hypothetical protein n=1 Tax=Massilia oculi TaxID=945844 RepID=UPI0013B39766|nr:hypothetical protein [Massilia oculi]